MYKLTIQVGKHEGEALVEVRIAISDAKIPSYTKDSIYVSDHIWWLARIYEVFNDPLTICKFWVYRAKLIDNLQHSAQKRNWTNITCKDINGSKPHKSQKKVIKIM